VTGPSWRARTYLFDVDLCHGFDQVLGSGYHPDIATAAAAWRDLAGVSASDAEPAPAPADLLPHVLPGAGLIDGLFGRPLSDSHFSELYRGDRIVFAITDALEEAGPPVTWPTGDHEQTSDRADVLAEQFRAWAATTGVDLPQAEGPDDDIVTWLLHDWVTPGLPDDLALACSPHRIAAFTAYLMDDWPEEHRGHALALLQPWVRFSAGHSGVSGPAAEHALAWACRAEREPGQVGRDLGDHLNRPIDETTVTGPPLPDYAC
jgi:hypothetical protein